MSDETDPIFFPAHLSSRPLKPSAGLRARAKNRERSCFHNGNQVFQPRWAEARWITWMEAALQMGQMCQRPSGGDPRPHGWHWDPFFIWKAWHRVRVQRPGHAARPADGNRWGGGRLADFIFSNRRLSPTFQWPAHPGTPLRVRTGRPLQSPPL